MFSASRVLLRKLTRVLVAAGWCLGSPLASQAQLVAPVTPASAPATSDSMERAQRQADNVLRWIKVHADKPKAAPANPPPTPSPVAAKPPARNTAAANAAAAAAAAAVASVAAPAPETEPPPVAQDAPPAYATAPAVSAPAPVQAAPQPPPVPAVAVEPEIVLVAISQAQPELSKKIVETLNNDRVNVRFTVLPNGTVTNADIVQSSNRRLNKPTLDAVSTWSFQPIRANHTVTVELAFKD